MTACENSPFTVRTQRSGSRFVASCQGEMDMTTCGVFFAAVLPGVTDTTTDRVSVDLAEVTFLSAGGLRTLLLLLCTAHHNGKSFSVHDTQPQVRRVLDLFGFTTFKAGLVWAATMLPPSPYN
ncbi:STAS domain-containing protein [Lentzea albidocapillata subsp. violacea]|uniref:STAS domain-containing protein n=1 Tax=Lentzea albidocapillata subsp. violacea TaxID=128104 RepID=A0A1G9XGT2_9PSEU|nr:STAS domain-containing protein [Lentzea albidocapillata]SDM95958.1 STAS domain-containing protein [Lentzea albidocapillata subsp. violacea]